MKKYLQYCNRFISKTSLKQLCKILGEDAQLYLVGGSVRELLTAAVFHDYVSKVTDFDLATNLRPESLVKKLSQAGVRTIETGIKHGTVTALLADVPFEITTFRKPSARENSSYSDSIEIDLSGRDFTINAIAYDLNNLVLVDPFNGLDDIRYKRLRAVGAAADRFEEDPVRLLRMVRFGVGKIVEHELLDIAKSKAHLLQKVSVERLKDELSKILLSPLIREAFEQLMACDLLIQFIPEILPSVGFEQNEYHIHDVWGHTLDVLEGTPAKLELRLAALFHDLGKPASLTLDDSGKRHFYCHEKISADITKQVMRRLRFSNDEIRDVSLLVAEHMRPFTCGAAGVRRLMRDLGKMLDDWFLLKVADKSPTMSQVEFGVQIANFKNLLAQEIEKQKEPCYGKLALNGDDILSLGVKAGPLVGKILNYLEELVINNPELNQKQRLIDSVKFFCEKYS